MKIEVFKTKQELGVAAADAASNCLCSAIASRGYANLIVATGASQFEMLSALVKKPVDWSKVTTFHLDEYIGLPISHPASFRRYLKERFVDLLPVPLKAFHYVKGDAQDPVEECSILGKEILSCPIDVALVGIGENGHLAFNDPPADFDTEQPYLVVTLDDACRRQQLGEAEILGWFKSFEDVPERAISMSIRQIMKSNFIVVTCPDKRKADAVKKAVEGEVTNMVPSSILKNHPNCLFFLDTESASLLDGN